MTCVDDLAGTDRVRLVTPRGGGPGGPGESAGAARPSGTRAAAQSGVVVDRRPPDRLRFGFAQLQATDEDAPRAARAARDPLV